MKEGLEAVNKIQFGAQIKQLTILINNITKSIQMNYISEIVLPVRTKQKASG